METECSWLPAATVSSRRSFASTCSSSSSTSAQRAFTRHRTSCTTHTNNNNSNRSKSNSNKSSTHLTNTSRCLLSPSSSASSYFSSSASRASQLTASTGSYSNNSNSNKRHSSRVMSTYSSKSPAYCLSIHSIWWQCLLLLTCLLLTPSAVNAQYKPQWLDPMLAREIFVLNLEDGYFGCQVNESVDFLQLFELSKLCDGAPQCFRGSDELSVQLKCTDRNHCHPKMPKCVNGVCLDGLCYCNDGFGGKGCDLPDENECKYRPCDVFAHCTNTMGSFYCSCFPGYDGDGFTCHDINECEEPALAALCAENAECCNLPGHFVCKCKPGYTGNATESCSDIDECLDPDACGRGAICSNSPGSYSCSCPAGFAGDPTTECWDVDECKDDPCGNGAICTNLPGTYECSCPQGFRGNPLPSDGCVDVDECSIPPVGDEKPLCGVSANCINTPGGYFCQCPPGFTGNPRVACVDIDECPHACGSNSLCVNNPGSYSCSCKPGFLGDPYFSAGCTDENECLTPNACGAKAECYNTVGSYQCVCPPGHTGDPYTGCIDIDECQQNPCGPNAYCTNLPGSYQCECPSKYLPRGSAEVGCERAAVDVACARDDDCTSNADCVTNACRCRAGYQVKGIDCIDVDECRTTKNICGVNAKCTNSEGGYECECKQGYEKIDPSNPSSKCKDINECISGPSPCGVNAKCVNSEGSYSCLCNEGYIGDAFTGCRSPCDGVTCGAHSYCQVHEGTEAACMCDQGFTFDPNNITAGCIDINECDGSHGPSGLCGQGAICTNVPGSHHCYCPAGFTGDPFRYCEDIDECSRRYGPYGQCGQGATCTNTLGSFSCTCKPGYTGNPREGCTDIDECSSSFGPNGKCGYSAICTNTPGSFSCRCPPGSSGDAFIQCAPEHTCESDDACAGNAVCKDGKCNCPSPFVGEDCKHPCEQLFCGEHAKCELDSNGLPVCVCAPGYIGKSNSLPGCVDIDECSASVKACGSHAACRNTPGSYECICPHSFKGDPYSGCEPEARDQAISSICNVDHPCPANEECVSNGKTDQCVCRRGYIREKDGEACRDVNECIELSSSPCGMNAFCTNLDGGFVCHCPSSFTGNPYTICYPDVMICNKNNECPGNTICIDDAQTGKHCGCESPYVREGDYCIMMSRNCSSETACPANQECIYTGTGSGFCICPKGFTLDANGHCRDIDECTEMSDFEVCGVNSECINLPGSYQCLCSPGYTGNSRQGCTKIHNSCETDSQCPSNERCLTDRCECLPPFIKDGTSCKHPCDLKQCGQNAECALTQDGAVCQCKPGCTGNANTGCEDINECTSLMPIDPNGPCGPSAICINLLGSYKCQCASDSSNGDPYTTGCTGVSKCTSDNRCPDDTFCDSQAGQCIDACSTTHCGPNAQCTSRGHKGSCQCKTGFLGDPNDQIHGCKSPCDGVWCAENAQCIVSSQGQGVCQCNDGFIGNAWSGGTCSPKYECSLSRPCSPGQECLQGNCIDRCNSSNCGVGAKCDATSNHCVCQPFYVGDPDVLCVPPSASGPSCSPGCGSQAHCIYSQPGNKCVCNQGYTGNPYKACSLVPKCDGIQCGYNAVCLEASSSVECVCPAGYHGNPYIGCEDINECLQGNPCGTGANCINVIGSYQCVCPAGTIGNPLYACQPPRVSDREGSGCTISETCPRGLICYRGSCTKKDTCRDDSFCSPENSCIYVNSEAGRQCVDPCDTSVCGPNAYCSVTNHIAQCICNESFTGNAYDVERGCSLLPPEPLSCTSDDSCSDGNVCRPLVDGKKSCIDACENVQCGPNAACKVIDRRPECVCSSSNLDGNPFDMQHGCFTPVCLDNSACSEDEVCALISNRKEYTLHECQNVCRGFKCGNNAICRGIGHQASCTCRPNFKGDPYDLVRAGCQPDVPTCVDDSSCPDYEACRRRDNGLRNCTSVCENVRCGFNAHCVGRNHVSSCECLPGYIGDAIHGCQKPPQHLCNGDDECQSDKKCLLTKDGIRDCVDVCFNVKCPSGTTCSASNHQATCTCLSGYTRLSNDTQGACAPNLCHSNHECRDEYICIPKSDGILDCVNVCDGIRCGSNAICVGKDHQPFCACKEGFDGSPGDISIGCRPKDDCATDTDCSNDQVCRLNATGVKHCIHGCDENICGPNTHCTVSNHFVICSCHEGFTGQPDNKNVGCQEISAGKICSRPDQCVTIDSSHTPPQDLELNKCQADTSCNPSEICESGSCITGCRRDSDCTFDKACLNSQCVDPCTVQSPCGANAECQPVVHRPRCTCPQKYAGNPYDYCSLVPETPPPECTIDSQCSLGHICELDKCIPACRLDENCPHDQACINRQCLNPCDFPSACGSFAKCTAVSHRPRCSCSSGFTGDPNIQCTAITTPVCFHDTDCGSGSICESGKCIDACRSDDNCPFTAACINRRCQDPCSVFGACGRNALCRAENHKTICSCPPEFKGDANEYCDRAIVQTPLCISDSACQFGYICESGSCVEGCRNDDGCVPDKTCYNRQCMDPCSFSHSCGSNTDCVPNSHRPVCTCKTGFLGDPRVECKPLRDVVECRQDGDCGDKLICDLNRCVIGCRSNQACSSDEACINRLCQNPCGFFGVCGRNAECVSKNHTAHCSCPANFRGNPNTVCTEAPPECTKDSECLLGHICENSQCTAGCRHDNNCPEDNACINGLCANPCSLANACGVNAKCTPYKHRPRCECTGNYLGNPYVKCEPIPDDYCDNDNACPLGKICDGDRCIAGCRNDGHCKFEEACISKICQNPCSIYGACGNNALCKAINHDRLCSCLPDFTGDPKIQCERIKSPAECTSDNQCLLGQICSGDRCVPGCRTSHNCPNEQSCIKNKCLNACAVSGACGKGATCTPTNHVAVCSCPSGFRGDPDVECREISPECRNDDECGLEKICLKQKCVPGCKTHSNCPYDKACVNGFCQSPCDIGGMCGVNTICRSEKHEAHCSCAPGYTGDPLKQCNKVFVECEVDHDCGGGYVCAQNQCKDINECLKETLPCGPGAVCQNLPGWYKCSCPLPLVGNAYAAEGCRTPLALCFHDADCPTGQRCNSETQECFDLCTPGHDCPTGKKCEPNQECFDGCRSDHDCATNKKCHSESGACYDPCTTKDPVLQCKCGQNAICKTENHEATCYCPPGFEGYPDKVCLPIRECGVTYNCPGNLICLDSHTCGCPPTFFRENDYCFIKSQNCTTNNPCSPNEECVYTGDSSGFCVCPHGYELLPYGECRAISLCGETNPCAQGAVCHDKPGSYECFCPPETIGDPYVKGCQPIVGCTNDHDCPNDRECDSSKQCISPCHICGPNAECTVRDHKALCVCTHGKVGEAYNKQIGCFTPPPVDTPPEVRTIPPVQDLQVMCLADGVQVSVQLGGYDGIIYVKGHSNDANCRRLVTSNEVDSIDFKVQFGHCGLIHVDGEASFVLVVQKHPRLVTYRARAYHIKCVYSTGERTVTLGFNVSMITTSGTIANTGPPPTCLMSICTLDGREISSAEIGDDLLLKVDVQPDFIYGGFARSCIAKTMEDEGEFQYEVTDENGCATDPSIFGNWEYDPHQKQLVARFNAFKFPSSNNLRFQCNIRVCFGSCPPINCDGVDAYGRRRRRQVTDEDLTLTDAYKEGALREEIMVQSNAILTFEKREPSPSAPIEGPRIEDIDHVCLPKLGLILSMIITTLLALVAVAVAISCWLMAYRRRPKRHHTSSPHSTSDYPNAMYATPDPEPMPDYYHHPSRLSSSRHSLHHAM